MWIRPLNCLCPSSNMCNEITVSFELILHPLTVRSFYPLTVGSLFHLNSFCIHLQSGHCSIWTHFVSTYSQVTVPSELILYPLTVRSLFHLNSFCIHLQSDHCSIWTHFVSTYSQVTVPSELILYPLTVRSLFHLNSFCIHLQSGHSTHLQLGHCSIWTHFVSTYSQVIVPSELILYPLTVRSLFHLNSFCIHLQSDHCSIWTHFVSTYSQIIMPSYLILYSPTVRSWFQLKLSTMTQRPGAWGVCVCFVLTIHECNFKVSAIGDCITIW